jgi:hypothetical protein
MSTQDAIVEDISTFLAAMLPQRLERWAECARIANRHLDGISAWEALSANGYVPQEWVSDASRWFALPRQFYRRKRALEWVDPSLVKPVTIGTGFQVRAAPSPIDRSWAAMLAAMGPALIEAEALAREFVVRSAGLTSAPPSAQRAQIAPPSTTVWFARARRRPATSQALELALRSVGYYWRAFDATIANLVDQPCFSAPLRDALSDRLGPPSNWSGVTLEAKLIQRGFDRQSISVVQGAYAAHRMLRALRETAPDAPTIVSSPRNSRSFTMPARSQIADPFEPWLALLARGVHLCVEHPSAVALSTQLPPSHRPARV